MDVRQTFFKNVQLSSVQALAISGGTQPPLSFMNLAPITFQCFVRFVNRIQSMCTWPSLRIHLVPILMSVMISKCAAAEEQSLWLRLGGEPVIQRVVAEAVDKVVADPHVNQSFRGVNLKRLDAQIVLQFCALTGGGCSYDGDDMKTAHAGLAISEEEFYGLVDAFRDAMNDNGVGEREKNELLRLLAPMKRDIVTH